MTGMTLSEAVLRVAALERELAKATAAHQELRALDLAAKQALQARLAELEREVARLKTKKCLECDKPLEDWRFDLCETCDVPEQEPTPEHRCGVRGFAESGDDCPACHAPGGRHAPVEARMKGEGK